MYQFILYLILWISLYSEANGAVEKSPDANPSGQLLEVELYGCKDLKIPVGRVISDVPSYPFYQSINVRIRREPFPGCKKERSQTSKFTFLGDFIPEDYLELSDIILKRPLREWKTKPEDELTTVVDEIIGSLETHGMSISPQGYLNVQDHNYDLEEFCVKSYSKAVHNGTSYNVSLLEVSYCPYNCSDPSSLCIPKCCPLGQSIRPHEPVGCFSSGEKVWKGFMYDDYGKLVDHEKLKKQELRYHYFRQLINCDRKTQSENESLEYWYMKDFKDRNNNKSFPKTSFRLTEKGKLAFLGASRKFQELKSGVQFCIDGFQEDAGKYSGSEDYQVALVCSGLSEKCYNDDKYWKHLISAMYMGCLFTASLFYLATTVVYLLLWDSQKVHGWTVVSLMVSLFFMCSSTATAHLLGLFGGPGLKDSVGCKANAIIAHFFYIASFTWLSIVNFDIWSTFRALQRRNEKDLTKLIWYSLLGWGIPLTFICISITLNEVYPERESMVVIPEYGDSLCFVASWAQGPYIYYPLIVPILIILLLTGSTFWNLFGFQRDAAMARTSSSKSDRKLAKLYLKLSLILGTSWSFEVISWLASDENCQHWIWMVTDFYNVLSAILIFVFFGCKNSNLISLEDKYTVFKKLGLCRSCRKSYAPGETSGSGTKSTGVSKDKISSMVVGEESSIAMKSFSNNGLHNQAYDSGGVTNR